MSPRVRFGVSGDQKITFKKIIPLAVCGEEDSVSRRTYIIGQSVDGSPKTILLVVITMTEEMGENIRMVINEL